MTVIGSQALQAMREAAWQLDQGDWVQANKVLQAAIAKEEAKSDPRVEVLARVLEPAAFDDPLEGWTVAQQAELREDTMQAARAGLIAVDAYEAGGSHGMTIRRAPTNAELKDATIGH